MFACNWLSKKALDESHSRAIRERLSRFVTPTDREQAPRLADRVKSGGKPRRDAQIDTNRAAMKFVETRLIY